jgi:hypothetical protein
VKDTRPRTKVAPDQFIAGARRALLRAYRNVRRENEKLGLPVIGERSGDAADVAWPEKARKKPMHYRPLEEVLRG